MPLVSVEQAREYLKAYRAEDEAFLQRLLDAATATVTRYTGRKLEPEPGLVAGEDTALPVAKTFRVPRSGEVRVPDLRVVDSATVGGLALINTTFASAYELTAREGEPATHLRLLGGYTVGATLTITGRWGFNPPPPDAVDAIYRITARMFAERDARYADTVQASLESAAFSYFRQLPPSVKFALDLLRVPKVALV